MSRATSQADEPQRASTTRARRSQTRRKGGVRRVRDGVWRVDVEIDRDLVTQHRRRVSKTVYGTRDDAEIELAQPRVVAHEKRLPPKGHIGALRNRGAAVVRRVGRSRSDRTFAATLVTVRSAVHALAATVLADGGILGDFRLARLTWQEIEQLYLAMRAPGLGSGWVRRCARCLGAGTRVGSQARSHPRQSGEGRG